MVDLLKASTDMKTLSEKTEACLSKLQYQFIRNGTKTLVEYEILKPCYFRIVIEPRKDLSVHTLPLPSISPKQGSTIDVRFDIDSDNSSIMDSKERAKLFFRTLVESLPQAPWKGLGLREKGNEERRWKDYL